MLELGSMLNNMPELPEVETVRSILEPLIKNKTIDNIDIFYDRLIISDKSIFKKALIGETFKNITRIGKYLFFHLTNDLVLISHLRMEGKWRYIKDDNTRIKSTSLVFYFKDNTALSFDDTRKFGILYLSNEKEYMNLEMIKKLGVEGNKIEPSNYKDLYPLLKKNKPIKELITDQSIISGVGNIYADESLFLSNIHPLRKGSSLSDKEINLLLENINKILNKAILLGGSTVHTYHPSEGIDGKFQETLKCYGMVNTPCPNCGTRFHKIFLNGRGTTFCPNCQIDPTLEKAIGITGPIGSGKSIVLKHLESKGYLTISSDELVHELYRVPYIQNKVSKILKINFNIDDKKTTFLARQIMIKDKDKKEKVENFIYPILEDKIIEIIKNNDDVAIEVPLLFKAHLEYLFKKIFVINIDKEKQINNLKKRNDDIESSINLNKSYSYDKNNKKIVIISNNDSIDNLINQIDKNLD